MNDIDVKTWWTIGLSIYGLVLGWVIWLRKPGEEAGRAVTELRKELTHEMRALGDRMVSEWGELRDELGELRSVQDRLSVRVEHTPARDEVTEVAGNVKAIEREIKGLVGTQTSQSMVLNRIESFLLNERRNR